MEIQPFALSYTYRRGDIVTYNGYLYECREDHKNTLNSPEDDTTGTLWRRLPINFPGDTKRTQAVYQWNSDMTYLAGALVYDGRFLYESQEQQKTDTFDEGNWLLLNDISVQSNAVPYFDSLRITRRYWAVNDLIIVNGILYICTQYHLGNNTMNSTELQYWNLVGTLPLKAYIYTVGVWYNRYTVVRYNGYLYICVVAHQSISSFDSTKWIKLCYYDNLWARNTFYRVGVVFKQAKNIYICKTEHTSPNDMLTNTELTNFDVLAYLFDESGGGTDDDSGGGGGGGDGSTTHYPGEVQVYNGRVYYCTTQYTSPTIDLSKYKDMGKLPLRVFRWKSNTSYPVLWFIISDDNSKVSYANQDHISGDNIDQDKWNLLLAGISEWQPNTSYIANQPVIYNGKIYLAKSAHTSFDPFDDSLWVLFIVIEVESSDSLEDRDSDLHDKDKPVPLKKWTAGDAYNIDDYVMYNGAIYKVKTTHTATNFVKQVLYFTLVSPDVNELEEGKTYEVGDLIKIGNNIFKVTISFTASGDTPTTNELRNLTLYFIGDATITEWEPSTHYYVGDLVMVEVDGVKVIFKCIVEHVSAGEWNDTEKAKWEEVTAFPVLVQKYITGNQYTIPDWEPNTKYEEGDLVIYNGKLYKCKTTHTSSENFEADEDKWEEVVDDIDADDWSYNTEYNVGDKVIYLGKLYICIVHHRSGATFNSVRWELVSNNPGITVWQPNMTYKVGDIVVYKGKIYKIIIEITSGDDFDESQAEEVGELENTIDVWQPNTDYEEGDTVKVWDEEQEIWRYYKCITAHTSRDEFDDEEKIYWEEIDESDAQIVNDAGREYDEGDIVKVNGKLYIVIKPISATNSSEDTVNGSIKPISSQIVTWKPSTVYVKNQLVLRNGVVYLVPQDIVTSSNPTTDFNNLGGLVYVGTIILMFLEWQSNTQYEEGDLVVFDGKLYICIEAHTSDSEFDNEELENWEEVGELPLTIEVWKSGVEYTVGDLVYVADENHPNEILGIYICIQDHTSNDFSTEGSYWKLILGNLTEYQVGATYPKDAVIKYDGQLVTANSKQDSAPWVKTFCMPIDLEEYDPEKEYKVNDMVRIGDAVFRCTVNHQGSEDEKELLDSIDIASLEEWQPDTDYKEGDIVLHEGKLYRCNTDHHSSGGSSGSSQYSDAKEYNDYLEGHGSSSGVIYNGDIVKVYNSDTGNWDFYKCVFSHDSFGRPERTSEQNFNSDYSYYSDWWEFLGSESSSGSGSGGFDEDIEYWDDLGWEFVRSLPIEDENWTPVGGKVTIKTWKNYSPYTVGDLVVSDGKVYRCTSDHTATTETGGPAGRKGAWEVVYTIKDWEPNAEYVGGEVIKYNGVLFQVIIKIYISGSNFKINGLKSIGVSIGTTDRVIPLSKVKKWTKGSGYVVGDYVLVADGIYKVTISHTAKSFPSDKSNFTPVYVGIKEWESDKEYKVGDIIFRGDTLYICTTPNRLNTFSVGYWDSKDLSDGGSSGSTSIIIPNYISIITSNPTRVVTITDKGKIQKVVKMLDMSDKDKIIPSKDCIENILDDADDTLQEAMEEEVGTRKYSVVI